MSEQDDSSRAAKLEAKAARLRAREEAKLQAAKLQAEGEAAQPGLEPARAQVRTWRLVAIVAGALFVVSAAVDVPIIVNLSSQSHSRANALHAARALDADRATVLADATQFGRDFGTYNYKTIDQDFARVLSHLTPSFAKTYSGVADSLKQTDVQLKGQSTATVQGVAIQSINSTQAVVLVFLDQSVQSTQVTAPRLDRNRLQMTLQKQPNGSWLMSELKPL